MYILFSAFYTSIFYPRTRIVSLLVDCVSGIHKRETLGCYSHRNTWKKDCISVSIPRVYESRVGETPFPIL